jgi:hypothetical protein
VIKDSTARFEIVRCGEGSSKSPGLFSITDQVLHSMEKATDSNAQGI